MPQAMPQPDEAAQREPAKSSPAPPVSVPATGRGAAFQDIKRQLTDTELASPGTQKLLLEMLFAAEADRDEYKNYVPKYYEAERRASVLEVQLAGNKANETLSTVGIGVGGTIIGLAPLLWSPQNLHGQICLGLGVVLVVGAVLGRILYR